MGSKAFFSEDGVVLDVVNDCVALAEELSIYDISYGVAIFIVNGVEIYVAERPDRHYVTDAMQVLRKQCSITHKKVTHV